VVTDELRYPIGPFVRPAVVSAPQLQAWIEDLERLPSALRALVERLSPEQLEIPYRPGGWRVRQVVHHLADSHMNSFIRFKWALTEPRPTIKPYLEARWAELPDSAHAPVGSSLDLLEALHRRWVDLLVRLGPTDLEREFVHPDSGPVRLDVNVGIYAWHGRHHLAHLSRLAEREGW
jgi:hypothetical protein